MPASSNLVQVPRGFFEGGANITNGGLEGYINQLVSASFRQAELIRGMILMYKDEKSVYISAAHGEDNELYMALPDGKERIFNGPMEASLLTDLDEGQAVKENFYYSYLVPDPADDTALTSALSLNAPAPLEGGPVGFEVSAYRGAFWYGKDNRIAKFKNTREKVMYKSSRIVENKGPTQLYNEGPTAVNLANFVPKTAGYCSITALLTSKTGTGGLIRFFADGAIDEACVDFIKAQGTNSSQLFERFPLEQGTKQIFRKIEESGDLDSYLLLLKGWADDYI